MWFYFGVSFMAMLSMLDMAIFTYIGYTFKVSPIYYSVVAAAWSVTYITGNKLFSALSDSGKNKDLMLLAFVFISTSMLLFWKSTLVSVTLAYFMHAMAVSTANLAMSTSIYEIFDSSDWKKYSTFQRILQNLLRGTTLIVISSGIINATLSQVLMLTSAIGALSFFVLPSISLDFERKLHMLGKNVTDLIGFASTRGILTTAIENARSMEIGTISFMGFSDRHLPRGRILVSTFLAVAVGDFVFTAMPLLIKTSVTLSNYWMAQGITGITVAVAALLINALLRGDKKIAIAIIAMRGLWLSLAMPLMYSENTIVFYLIGMYFLGLAMDATLFNLYSEASSGYGAHSYFISREVGTLTGSLLAGFVLALGVPAAVILIPILLSIASVIQLI
uniref:MFS transporter n=1 Tax=Fervidicoccus fontis TaxID=683846 RepID=A0A7J3SKT1_9CREN